MPLEPQEFRKRCRGILPVQFCPYTEDRGAINVEALRSNTEFLVDFTLEGNRDLIIMTNGSTTEFYANSIEEQKTVIKTVVETVDGRVPVIAGVSQAGTRETIKMAKYAEEVGADCVMVVTPYYHTPFAEGMYQHYKSIAEAVKIAVIIYNNPAVSAAMIDPQLTARLAEMENIVAIKDNSPLAVEWFMKAKLIDEEKMALCIGTGEINYVAAAAFGFRYKGFITALANYAPQISYSVYEAVEKDRDFEKAYNILVERVAPLVEFMARCIARRRKTSILPYGFGGAYIYQAVGKAAMDLIPDLYGGPCRLPMEELTEEEKRELEEVLRKIGIL